MKSLVRSAAACLSTSLLALLFGFSSVPAQDLRETDALCNADGCFVVYFQRKTFLDSWRACKVKGGNLATIKRKEDATAIATLFSTVDLRHSRTKVQVWIGLQRQPRQCTAAHPLRGFSWTTGDQDTEYTNWQNNDSPSLCSVSRCVAVSYRAQEHDDNFKWIDGACVVSADGYLCHYAYRGMCPSLWSEGKGSVKYTTPFNLLTTLLTHVPSGSVATVLCPTGREEEQSVSCMLREDGSVGWSRESPLCSLDFSESHNPCEQDNGECEHLCSSAGGYVFCECPEGYRLGEDGQSCELPDACRGASCESDYNLNLEQRQTGRPAQEEQSVDWRTDPPRVSNPGTISFTTVPQEEVSSDSAPDPLTQETAKDEDDISRVDWLEGGQRAQSELKPFSTTIYTTLHSFSSTTTPGWYEGDEEEATTAPPSYSTSPISEGALNWWTDVTTLSQSPGNPQGSITDYNMPAESSYHKEPEEGKQSNVLRENFHFKEEELNREEKDVVEITHGQNLAFPTMLTSSQPRLTEGGRSDDSATKDRRQKQGSIWLIVGLFIPICIFIVVMVALGIAYCNRCAVKSHNKDATDCYHWISGAHDKQGDSNPSAGTQTHV